MATFAKCDAAQRKRKQTTKPAKSKSQVVKKKNSKLGTTSHAKFTKSSGHNTMMVNLKAAYGSLEYKHYHNIGSRRAAEQIITYDESLSLPIYESRVRGLDKTECRQDKAECKQQLGVCNRSEGKFVKNCTEGSNMSQKKFKCSINVMKLPSKNLMYERKPKHSIKLAIRRKLIDRSQGVKMKSIASKIKKCKIRAKDVRIVKPVTGKREASLNATAKLNLLYHESDGIHGIESSDTNEEDITNRISSSVCSSKTGEEKNNNVPDCIKDSLSISTSTTEPPFTVKQCKVMISKNDTLQIEEKSQGLKPNFSTKKTIKDKNDNEKTMKAKTKKVYRKRAAESKLFAETPKFARRMASLNAQAIIAASELPRQTVTQKAARTEMLEAARTKVYVSQKKDRGRWVEGRGEDVSKAVDSDIMPWNDMEILSKDDGLREGQISASTNDAEVHLHTQNTVPAVDRPICPSYQSPIHINVEDCGQFGSNHSNQSHIATPLPRYAYPAATHSRVVAGPHCQSYSLANLGSLSGVQMVPFHQTYNSAFSVPCNHSINVPCNHGNTCSMSTPYYGYVHGGYYPGAGPPVLQPLPEPCLVPRPHPHPLPVQCPQAEVKVLIHNPHTDHPFIPQSGDPLSHTSIKSEPVAPGATQATCAPQWNGSNELPPVTKQMNPVLSATPHSVPMVTTDQPIQKQSCAKISDNSAKPPENRQKLLPKQQKEKKKKDKDSNSKTDLGKSKKGKSDNKDETPKKKKNSSDLKKVKSKKDKCKSEIGKVEKEKKSKPQKVGKYDKSEIKQKNLKKVDKLISKNESATVKKNGNTTKASKTEEELVEKVHKELPVKKDQIRTAKEDEKSGKKEENSGKKEGKNSKKEDLVKKAKRKQVDNHGWSWEGAPEQKSLLPRTDGPAVERRCYPAMKHVDGDMIRVGDCVLLCSGPRKADIPYVAKVVHFWENTDDGEMMMSLLWYYRPEHTDAGPQSHHLDCEVFASKHRDENSVACIEDKCFVLTFNEYCRYRSDLRCSEESSTRLKVVPEAEESYARKDRLPPLEADPEIVLLCRQVYDFRQKRVLKNPS